MTVFEYGPLTEEEEADWKEALFEPGLRPFDLEDDEEFEDDDELDWENTDEFEDDETPEEELQRELFEWAQEASDEDLAAVRDGFERLQEKVQDQIEALEHLSFAYETLIETCEEVIDDRDSEGLYTIGPIKVTTTVDDLVTQLRATYDGDEEIEVVINLV